jgi:hypothetical protein
LGSWRIGLLKEHRKRQAAERLRGGNGWKDHDLVFATRHGGPIERTEDWRSWKSILEQAGCEMPGFMMPGTLPRRC